MLYCVVLSSAMQPEYYYNRLESHWGKDAILHCGMTRAEVARLVIDDKTRMLYGVPSWSHRPWHWLFYRQEIDQVRGVVVCTTPHSVHCMHVCGLLCSGRPSSLCQHSVRKHHGTQSWGS